MLFVFICTLSSGYPRYILVPRHLGGRHSSTLHAVYVHDTLGVGCPRHISWYPRGRHRSLLADCFLHRVESHAQAGNRRDTKPRRYLGPGCGCREAAPAGVFPCAKCVAMRSFCVVGFVHRDTFVFACHYWHLAKWECKCKQKIVDTPSQGDISDRDVVGEKQFLLVCSLCEKWKSVVKHSFCAVGLISSCSVRDWRATCGALFLCRCCPRFQESVDCSTAGEETPTSHSCEQAGVPVLNLTPEPFLRYSNCGCGRHLHAKAARFVFWSCSDVTPNF